MFSRFATLALLMAAPAIAQERAPELERAKAIRAANPDASERIVRGVLATKPDDYFALYHMGLIEDARAARLAPGPERLAHYRRAAAWLERTKGLRAAQGVRDATIFNTLGVVYLAAGDLRNAQANFDEAVRHEAALTPASKGKLYSNIGYLKALQGQGGAAVPELQKAARFGNAAAQTNLNRIEAAPTLFGGKTMAAGKAQPKRN